MFVDARTQPDKANLTADICIIGAGPAGLALAHTLLDSGMRILIVESGGDTDNKAPNNLAQGSSNDPNYPFQSSRARGFGGTSARWYGACIPLDATDFDARPWVPHSGWPITARDIAPYLDAAKVLWGIPSRPDNPISGPFTEGALTAKAIWIGTPLNIGDSLGPAIRPHSFVDCLLNATVTHLETDPAGARVTAAHLRTAPDNCITVRAKAFVLATGGIENARLLLNSNTHTPRGLGNTHGIVGRYHIEHPLQTVGLLALNTHRAAALPFTNPAPFGQTRVEHTFGLSAKARQRHQLLDLHIRAYRYSPRESHPAVIAAKALVAGPSAKGLGHYLRHHGRHLPGQIAPYAAWHLNNKLRRNARFGHLRLSAFVEVEPHADNRVTLSDRRDPYGQPLPHLHYATTTQARDSIRRSMALIADDLTQRGVGTLSHAASDIAHLEPYDAYGLHHMGATRMSDDPRHGVVDSDCCVHGVHNLFIAGSSVFATGGAANPTLTIAALSLRLGDRLRDCLPDIDV